MSRFVADRAEVKPLPELGGSAGNAGAVYRLRQVHVAYGGRIRASWQSVLATTPFGKASTGGGGSNCGLGGRGGGQGSLCGGGGYSWAIVRTRGGLGDDGGEGGGVASGGITDTCTPSSRVIEQGAVSPGGRWPTEEGDGDNSNGKTKVAVVDPSSELPSSTASPWRWHCFDVDTTAWLPGDLISLWIRLDDVAGKPAEAVKRGGGELRGKLRLSRHPCVRGFELEVVDDATAEEIARRARCILRRTHHHRAPASSSSNRLNEGRSNDGGAVTSTDLTCCGNGSPNPTAECYFAPAFAAAATGPGTSVDTVQLDFAACPMNMAAAGGSWA